MPVPMTDEQFDAALLQAKNEHASLISGISARVEAHDGETVQDKSGVEVLQGILRQRGWDERDGQIQMTRYVDEAHEGEPGRLSNVGVVGIVAPVGTGKTLGYLAPALARGERVVIATSTKALQDQIVGEELPRLREDMLNAFGKHITYTVMKGKSNYACLGAETRVITRDGTKAIAELAGRTVQVLDGNGDWVDAPIKEYGRQRLLRITLTGPGAQRRVVRATADHRWFLQQNINAPGPDEVTTADLVPGDRLAYKGNVPVAPQLRPSQFGVAHGVVFGDGTVLGKTDNGLRTGTVVLHGEKRELARYFSESEQREGSSDVYAEPFVRVCDLPNGFKELPSIDEAPSYLFGWLAGYCATDGHVSASGTVTLASSRREHVDFAEAVAHRLGIATYGINGGERVDAEGEPYSVSFNGKTLGPNFYLRTRHREHGPELASANTTNYKRWLRSRRWVVESVEDDAIETVYCAEVPTTQSFVLEGNILTGNCLSHVDQTVSRFKSQMGEFSDADATGNGSGDDELDRLRIIGQQARLAFERDDIVNFDADLALRALSFDTQKSVTAKHSCPARQIDLNEVDLTELAADNTDVWRAAYAKSMMADVVVMNTALLVEEVRKQNNKVNPAQASILEGVGMVVIDEAHHAPNIVTSAFSSTLSRRDALKAAAEVDKRVEGSSFEDTTRNFFQAVDSADDNIKKRNAFHEEVSHLANDFVKEVAAAAGDQAGKGSSKKAESFLADFRTDVVDVIKEIGDLSSRKSKRGETDVYSARVSVDFNTEGTDFTLAAVPIDVSSFHGRLVTAMKTLGTYSVPPANDKKTIVLCSGTMNASVPRLLGAGGGKIMHTVETPFDPRRARLCVPGELPTPKDPKWEESAFAAAEKAIRATDGRTLFLCTSNRMVDAFYARARNLPFPVLKQGDATRTELINRFAKDENSVLVATMGYWEGLDVPGPALSLVIMDKVPFPVPSDAISKARKEWVEAEGGNAFSIVDCGHASTMIAQGAGRLIRAESDTGGVLILDSRLANMKYGASVLSQIDRHWGTYKTLDPFLGWLRAVADAADAGEPDAVLDYKRDAQPLRARPAGTVSAR